jgi:apolipoprotein N-acyltransferase
MLVAAFPPIDMEFLAWIGMVPLFFALSGRKIEGREEGLGIRKKRNLPVSEFAKRGFLLGLVWGITFFMGTIYWVVNSMANYGGVPIVTSIVILILLALYLSLFPALFGLAISSILSPFAISLLFRIVFVSSLWVAIEYIRTNMITVGFPWVLLGYSQSSFLPLIQIADITGVYGISLLIMMVNMFIFSVLSYWLRRKVVEIPAKGISTAYIHRLPIKEGLLVFIILISVLVYGFIRIYQTDEVSKNWKTLRIGIAQGNIDQAKKWDASFQQEIVEIYKNLTLSLAKKGSRLIIWPESSIPFYLQSEKELGYEIYNIAKATNAYLLTGADSYGLGLGGEVRYYNSAFLISSRGEIIGKYDKTHLVPFGEYVPLKKYLPFIHKLIVGVGDFSSGKWLQPLEFDGNSFGVLICFESIFPELARGFIKEGAGFLINITNDAWFGRTSAPYQHFSQAVFRAVENKVFLIRAANTGISGVVDPVGRIKMKSGIFTREDVVDNIMVIERNQHGMHDFNQGFTFYTRYGDIFAIGCIIIAIIILITKKKRIEMRNKT